VAAFRVPASRIGLDACGSERMRILREMEQEHRDEFSDAAEHECSRPQCCSCGFATVSLNSALPIGGGGGIRLELSRWWMVDLFDANGA